MSKMSKMSKTSRILLIGPKLHKNGASIGGIVVLFEDLITYCSKEKISFVVIDTNKSNYSNLVFAYFKIIISIYTLSKKTSHISLHGTAMDYLFIAPFAIIMAKLRKSKISLRKFAGSFHKVYSDSNWIIKKTYSFVLKNADILFFESKFLVEKFTEFNPNTFWLPNSRFKYHIEKTMPKFSKKFVFISQIKESKGIFDFMAASESFDSTYTFDIYGPIMDNKFELKLKMYKNVSYKGFLKAEQVTNTLLDYDILVLPTFHDGEGYPGIIIEAFSVGIPVITTEWNAIPEIVINNHNGLIVPIKDHACLQKAISLINDQNYSKFSQNAFNSFNQFNSNNVYKKYIRAIE